MSEALEFVAPLNVSATNFNRNPRKMRVIQVKFPDSQAFEPAVMGVYPVNPFTGLVANGWLQDIDFGVSGKYLAKSLAQTVSPFTVIPDAGGIAPTVSKIYYIVLFPDAAGEYQYSLNSVVLFDFFTSGSTAAGGIVFDFRLNGGLDLKAATGAVANVATPLTETGPATSHAPYQMVYKP